MTDRETKPITADKPLQTPQQSPVVSHFDDMDRWFDQVFLRNWMQPLLRMGWPDADEFWNAKTFKVDVINRDTEVVVRAELPGVSKDDLDVSLSDNILTIRALSRHEATTEEGQYHRREISTGEMQRKLRLPAAVDGEQAKATFKDGVLEFIAPKLESANHHSIKVE